MSDPYKTYEKDPEAKLDYKNDFTEWLEPINDIISTSTWTVPTGITLVTNTKTDYTTTAWLSGGTDGMSYECVNHVVTRDGREDDRTILIIMTHK